MDLLDFMTKLENGKYNSICMYVYIYICNRIRYLISVKNDITYIISHNYANIKVDSYN